MVSEEGNKAGEEKKFYPEEEARNVGN